MQPLLRRSLTLGALAALFTLGSTSCQSTPPNGSSAGGSGNGSTSSSGSGGEPGTGGNAGMGTTSSSSSSSSGQGGVGGGAGGTGGQGAVGGMGGQGAGGNGGSGGCTSQQARCEYKTDTELDKQSYRQIAGYNCFKQGVGTEFVPLATCDYSETCELGNGLEASCVPCGPKGVRFGYREVDGVVKENCKGCKCGGGWSVYGCYAETATFGAPWADIVWQQGFEVIRFALLTTGEVKNIAAPNKQVTFQNLQINTMDIQLDGVVDFDVAAQVLHTDNFQQQHVWDMQARVVGICK